MDQPTVVGDLLSFAILIIFLSLFLRYLRRLGVNTQISSKQTACDYHNWKWDEEIHNFRCQNKNCGRIAGHDPPSGWQPPIPP